MTGIFDAETNTWKPSEDSDWQYQAIHPETAECSIFGCMIHAPSFSPANEEDWPYYPRADGRMERLCPHGIGHPDSDAASFQAKTRGQWVWVHGCDGCCVPKTRIAEAEDF